LKTFPDAVAISALTGAGIDDLLAAIQNHLYETYLAMDVYLPYREGKLLSLFHEQGQVERLEHVPGGVTIQGRIPGRFAARFERFLRTQQEQGE